MSIELLLAGSRFDVTAHVHGLPGKDHDRTLVTPGLVGLGDGATPLADDWPSPVPLVVAGLTALAASARAVSEVNAWWRQAILTASGGRSVPGQPSAALVVVREIDTHLEISMLGDCVALISRRTQSRAERLTDPTIPLRDAAAQQIDDPRRRRAKIVQNRSEMNERYWIFADDARAADHVLVRRVDAGEVELILLASDGFDPVLRMEFGIEDSTAWISDTPPLEVRSALESLHHRAAAGLVETATDDFSWVLLTAPT